MLVGQRATVGRDCDVKEVGDGRLQVVQEAGRNG